MKVLVTGHDGYIGTVLVPMLQARGHQVRGLDTCFFRSCAFGPELGAADEELVLDVQDATVDHVTGVDAVIHLAGMSNDPAGELNPDATYAINHRATTHLAELAKAAGVPRFLFSSSCSIYGAQGDEMLTEDATFNPVTPYGRSKELAEADLHALADDTFSPTYLRNATAYGASPRLRGDLVVNNLTGFAITTGQVFLKSDGSSWRPLVHIADISRAFCALLEADRDLVHDEAFNIGATAENYRIRDVAEIVAEVVPDCEVTLSDQAFNDLRNYRVSFAKYEHLFPDDVARWTVRAGVEELHRQMVDYGLTIDDLEGSHFMRVLFLRRLQAEGRLGDDIRWVA